MTNKEKYEHWLGLATYDLETADAMLKTGRYSYVAFACQQAIEKLAKGIYVYDFGKEAPFTHNIHAVLKHMDYIVDSDEYKLYETLFVDLLSYYISGRYASYKDKIARNFDEKSASELIDKSKEAFAWLQSQVKLEN